MVLPALLWFVTDFAQNPPRVEALRCILVSALSVECIVFFSPESRVCLLVFLAEENISILIKSDLPILASMVSAFVEHLGLAA